MGILNYAGNSEDERAQYIGEFAYGDLEGVGTVYWTNGDKCKTTWSLGDMIDDAGGKLVKCALTSLL